MHSTLLRYRRVLAVVAHPDDESFGLGALLSAVTQGHGFAAVLCFTHGEASTLGTGDLHAVRAHELEAAAGELGVTWVRLLDHPDGHLDAAPLAVLCDEVTAAIDDVSADAVLAFSRGGITGHRDHIRATEAALAAARSRALPVVTWTLSEDVAQSLNAQFSTSFEGCSAADGAEEMTVDRKLQLRAIARHESQAAHNPVLSRRLALQGDREWIRVIEPRA